MNEIWPAATITTKGILAFHATIFASKLIKDRYFETQPVTSSTTQIHRYLAIFCIGSASGEQTQKPFMSIARKRRRFDRMFFFCGEITERMEKNFEGLPTISLR